MPWTNPIPSQPGKQWLYISNTTSILGNTPNEDSLICWAYAQGYTGIILYQLNTMTGGGNSFVSPYNSQLTAFITKCNSNGLEVGGAFGGSKVIDAILALGGFKAAVSEIEWWRYSYNLPYQSQNTSGFYSFYDSLQIFINYKPLLTAAGIDLIAYTGFTKAIDYEYQYKYPVVQEYINPVTGGADTLGREGFAINGNFTSDNTAPIVESNVFYYDDVIRLNNFPSPSLQTYVKLSGVQPTELVSGTTLFTATGAEVSDGRIVSGDYKPEVQILSYFISGGVVNLNVAPGHGVLPVTRLVVNSINYPEFALSFRAPSSQLDIQSVAGNVLTGYSNFNISNISSYSASAGVVTLTFPPLSAVYTVYNPTATAALLFQLGDSIVVTGLGAGFDGTFTVTNVTANSIEYSAAVSNTPSTATTGSTVKTQTRALQTYGTPAVAQIRMFTVGTVPTVSNLHEIVYIGPSRFFSPYAGEIALRGDKTYHFANNRVSKIAIENYNIASPSNIFTVTGTAIYNAGLQQTRVFLTVDPNAYVGSGPQYTTFLAMANLDVVYESNSSYGLPGTELQQLIPHVDGHALTVYEQNIPNYNYIRNRVLELGAGADNYGLVNPKVYYLFGAYESASRNFYLGLNTFGTNANSPYPKKGPKEAYDYMSFSLPTATTPNNPIRVPIGGVPLYADLETDANVLGWVEIAGSLTFEAGDLQGYPIKNGSKMILGPTGPSLNITVTQPSPAGSVALPPITFCDDCLPRIAVKYREITSNVATITTGDPVTGQLYPHDLVNGAPIYIAGVGVGYDGYHNITVTSPTTFTFPLVAPDEAQTLCSSGAVAIASTEIVWTVTPPAGGSGSMTTSSHIFEWCTASPSNTNTLNFNGVGLYTITASVYNPQLGTINELTNRVATDEVVYSVLVTTTAPTPLTINCSITQNNTCPGDKLGILRVDVTSGTPDYTYELYSNSISPGNLISTDGPISNTFFVYSGLYEGTYVIVVTDSLNNVQTCTLTLSAPVCPFTITATNPLCPKESGIFTGTIKVEYPKPAPAGCCEGGGIPNISWEKNGISLPALNGNFNPVGLSVGVYTITIITSCGCKYVYSVTLTNPTGFAQTGETINPSVCNTNSGAVTVYGNNSCGLSVGNVMWYSLPFNSPTVGITNITGNGSSILVTTSSPHGFAAGQIVSITGVTPVAYNSPTSNPSYVINLIVSPTQFTTSCPVLTPYVSGGTVGTEFLPGVNTNVVSLGGTSYAFSLAGVPGGSYQYIITDACGCVYKSGFDFLVPSVSGPSVSITPDAATLCFDPGDDSVGTTINSLVATTCPSVSYVWTNLTTGQIFGVTTDFVNVEYPGSPGANNLVMGNNQIQLVVTDCNGCPALATTNILVTEFDNPITSMTITGNGTLTICPGSPSVYIDIVGGETNPAVLASEEWLINDVIVDLSAYFTWPTLEVTNEYFLGPVYTPTNPNDPLKLTFQQTDLNGCISSFDIYVDPPLQIDLEIIVKNNQCGAPGNLGEIDVTVVNGCPLYTYTWTGPPGFVDPGTQDITGLVNGTYQLVVTDSAGNTANSGPIVVANDTPGIDNVDVINVCNNGANGSISFDIVDAVAPYDITWSSLSNPAIDTNYSTNSPSITLTGLKPATYTFTVLDDLGCSYTTSFVIQNAPPIVITSTVWVPSCFSANDGRIDLNITGGNGAPYNIFWNNGATTASIEDLGAGIYSATVVDINGCSASFGINLNGASAAPMQMTEVVTNPNFQQGTLGSIQITSVTNGGGAPYTYVWTDANNQVIGNSALLDNLNEGTYTVTATGAAGCSISRTYTLQSRCDAFSYPEYRLQLYKFQCCAGQIAKKYVQLVESGRSDLAECLEVDLKYMTMVLDSLSCISVFPDPCLSCDDLNNIFNQMKKICDCDCCESDENAYTVRYDYETQTFIPVIPQISGGNPSGPVQCPPNCPPPQP